MNYLYCFSQVVLLELTVKQIPPLSLIQSLHANTPAAVLEPKKRIEIFLNTE